MNFTRRNFMKTGAAAFAGFTIAPNVILGKTNGHVPPSDQINIAGIGFGSQGGGDLQNIADPDAPVKRTGAGSMAYVPRQPYAGIQLQRQQRRQSDSIVQMGDAGRQPIHHANIYALCDVDTEYAAHIFNAYYKAKRYTDFREMIEKEKDIDGVLIGTPDHTHAIIAATAMKAGKAVFVEKPMAKTIKEVRYLAELAKKTGVVTQMGNQGHNVEGTYQTVEWIRSGVIGNVSEVHMWSNRPMWRQGYFDRPAGQAIPQNLDYDLWLGPAPEKPYNPATLHFSWRGLWDYGTGAMGDMGAHTFDAPIWALGLGMPDKIMATTTPYNNEFLPQAEAVKYHFPAREVDSLDGKKKIKMPECVVTWTDGGIKPYRPFELENGRALRECLYVGDKGMMMHGTHGASPELVPNRPNFKEPAKVLTRPKNIYVDWVEAIKEGRKAANDFEIASKLTEIMLLTNIAVAAQNTNITLEYDAANMRITNLEEANNYFHYEYRKGWELPAI
jgi:predicted dehydrogenase